MAVYTHISENDAEQLLAAYTIGTLKSLEPIEAGVSNSNYFLTTDQSKYVLTVYEKITRPESLDFFVPLMAHLAQNGILCPAPFKDKQGNFFQDFSGKKVAIVSFLHGKQAKTIEEDYCHQVGKRLARLHQAGRTFKQTYANDFGFEAWQRWVAECGARSDEVEAGLSQLITDELAFLQKAWPKDLPTGAIHGDYFPDNVFFNGGKFRGIIDFHYACTDFLAYDLAITVNAWCFPAHAQMDETFYEALRAGYESLRSLNEAEKTAFPILLRGAAVRFLTRRLKELLFKPADATMTPHNPLDYLKRLRFHQTHWSEHAGSC